MYALFGVQVAGFGAIFVRIDSVAVLRAQMSRRLFIMPPRTSRKISSTCTAPTSCATWLCQVAGAPCQPLVIVTVGPVV